MLINRAKVLYAIAVILLALVSIADARFPRGTFLGGTSFNGGKFQVNLNFPGIGGDYTFVNMLKNSDGGWAWPDNTGSPTPPDMDSYGYPIPGSSTMTTHGGVRVGVRLPAQAYIGGNCIPSQTGVCYSFPVNGKGTISFAGTITNSGATGTVTTGATTDISFSVPQDFRAGMEVPISGTNGTVSPNLTSGGATSAYTVCVAGLSATTIRLCLNDQVTPLTTTGSFTGLATVTYGRAAVGVADKGRVVYVTATSDVSLNVMITAQDATTPITYRNGKDGLAMVMQGSEEIRYEQWLAGTCPGGYNPRCQFGAAHLAKIAAAKPGVVRHLNTINTNTSLEVKWSDRKPVGYYSYSPHIYDRSPSVFGGLTTSVNNDYAMTFGSGAPSDKQQLILGFDATSVTVTNGANALVTWTSHNLSTGSPFNFFISTGGAAPGGVTLSTETYYAITSCGGPCNANNIRFATSYANAVAGTAVTTSSTGSSVLAHSTVIATTAVLSSGSSTIQWNDPTIQVNDQVSFTGISTLAYPFNNGASYFVKTVGGVTGVKADITVSKTSGGTALVSAQNGTFNSVKNPTLNLNGTGAIAIKDASGWGVGTVRFSQPRARALGGEQYYGTVTYDKVLNVWVKVGADSDAGTAYFLSGWAPETALEYCMAVGAHCWFTPPRYTVDGDTALPDYNPGLYAYVRANAPAWMIPRFETTPNEFWNNQFAASNLNSAHAVVYTDTAGWSQNTSYYQIAGKINSVLGQAVNAAYGGSAVGSSYQTVQGVQTFNFSTASGASQNAPRLTASDYVTQTAAAPTGYIKSAAYNWLTHVASAQYWSPGYYGTFVADALGAANAGGIITASASGTTLNVSAVNTVTSPVFGAGSALIQGPGVTPVTVSGTGPAWTISSNLGTIGSTLMSYRASGFDATAVTTYLDSANYNASFTGVLVAGVLTASSVTGFITTGNGNGGDLLTGSGVTPVNIQGQLTGTGGAPCPDVTCTGKAGTYSTNGGQTLGSRAMTVHGMFSIPNNVIMNANVFAFAQTYTNSAGQLLKLNGYEGTYSPDYSNFLASTLNDQLYADAKLVTSTPNMATGMYGYQAQILANFKAAGGEFPSQFNFTGLSPSGNAWSAIEDLYQPAPTPIWDAYKDYN